MVDFQTFKELGLGFLPQLPEFDIGDKVIYDLINKGFNIFATPNTFDDESLISLIPKTMRIYNLNTTRAFNNSNEIIYMHLGRGIPKAKGEYKNKEKSSSEQWIEYIKEYLFSEPVLQLIDLKKINDFDFSRTTITDFYMSVFYEDILDRLPHNSKIAYLGNKNEFFNKYNFIRLNNQSLDGTEDTFDCIIFNDVPKSDPGIEELIKQCYKALGTGGLLAVSIPLIMSNKNSPEEIKLSLDLIVKYLWNNGFREVSVQKQGSVEVLKLISDIKKLISKNLKSPKSDLVINKFVKSKLTEIIIKDNRSGKKDLFDSEIKIAGYGVIGVK